MKVRASSTTQSEIILPISSNYKLTCYMYDDMNTLLEIFFLHLQAILIYAFWLFWVPVVLQATHWHQYSSRPKIFSTCCLVISIVTCMIGSAAKKKQKNQTKIKHHNRGWAHVQSPSARLTVGEDWNDRKYFSTEGKQMSSTESLSAFCTLN